MKAEDYIFWIKPIDRSVRPPDCPKYQNGYCNYYECKCDQVNFKCEWEERKGILCIK